MKTETENVEPIFLHDGRLMQVHDELTCAGERCCVHAPSPHPLSTAPLNWRSDVGIMERICDHGVSHPDPDDAKVRAEWEFGVHGCDGCCRATGGTPTTTEGGASC